MEQFFLDKLETWLASDNVVRVPEGDNAMSLTVWLYIGFNSWLNEQRIYHFPLVSPRHEFYDELSSRYTLQEGQFYHGLPTTPDIYAVNGDRHSYHQDDQWAHSYVFNTKHNNFDLNETYLQNTYWALRWRIGQVLTDIGEAPAWHQAHLDLGYTHETLDALHPFNSTPPLFPVAPEAPEAPADDGTDDEPPA